MRKENKKSPNESNSFRCGHCKLEVPGQSMGTKQRNHCPSCLYSLHVDVRVGDRKAECQSQMEPIGITLRPDGEIMIVHRCLGCGKISLNRIAGDDNPETVLTLVKKGGENTAYNITFVISMEDIISQLYGK